MQEEAEGVLTMTSTYQDYFNDLHTWIQSKYFFGMVVIDCLHNSVCIVIMMIIMMIVITMMSR